MIAPIGVYRNQPLNRYNYKTGLVLLFQELNMMRVGAINKIGAIVGGLGLLTLWLIFWRLVSDAAAWFPSAAALLGLLLWQAARTVAARSSFAALALKSAAAGAIVLAIAAAFSVGAFLPGRLAEWLSPVMGRFGGWPALLILAAGFSFYLLVHHPSKAGWWLDLAFACALAALWVGSQVERQAAFPPPPTGAANLAGRFDILLLTGAGLAGLALLVYILAARAPGPQETGKSGLSFSLISRVLWRWSLLVTLIGLVAGLGVGAPGWWRFALLLGLGLAGGLATWLRARRPAGIFSLIKLAGWLLVWLLAAALAYGLVSEDLEVVLLRNTAERYVQQTWRAALGDERFATKAAGTMTGRVQDRQGQPVAGATVVVSDLTGQTFVARSGQDGRYELAGVPAGNYLPMATGTAYRAAATSRWGGRVATIRSGQTANGVDFTLSDRPGLILQTDETLKVSATGQITRDNPEPSRALRSTFSFENRGKTLEGGLVHEPPAELGPGPYPILLIVYPGPANAWESVSTPLAARGFVVVSYFPNRLLDLEGDLDDLNRLIAYAVAGRFSPRGDNSKIALVGGSVSTVYTYLMAQELSGSPAGQNFKATIKYGGLVDLFRFRYAWERGQIVIDPGISELEYLLVAFGRPDTRPELYLRFSPDFRLDSRSLPPTLLVHVNKDIIVPVEQSLLAEASFKRLGLPHRLLLYPELEHYLDLSKRDPAYADMLAQTVEFLKTYLK